MQGALGREQSLYPSATCTHLIIYLREVKLTVSMRAQATTLVEPDPSLYEALIRVSQAIGVHRDPENFFRALTRELHNVIQFDSIGVVQYDGTGRVLEWHLA